MNRNLHVFVAALVATSGCGGGDGGGTSRSGVALFANPLYVDAVEDGEDEPNSAEELNLAAALTSFGLDVKTFTGTELGGAGGFEEALAGRRTLVVPEMEYSLGAAPGLPSRLDYPTIKALREFVNGGGVVVLSMGYATEGQQAIDLFDAITGSALAVDECPESPAAFAITAAAAGTPFAGGPATLDGLSGQGCVVATSLPASALAIYRGLDYTGVAAAQVVLYPKEGGWVVLLGWDFYDAAPRGAFDGGWVDVMRRATQL